MANATNPRPIVFALLLKLRTHTQRLFHLSELHRTLVWAIVIGVAGAFALTRLMQSLLYGVKATDALTFAAIPILLAVIALLTSLIPARRAARIDPMVSLRSE